MHRYSGLILNVDTICGGRIEDVLQNAVYLAYDLNIMLCVTINDVKVPIHPLDEINDVLLRYKTLEDINENS